VRTIPLNRWFVRVEHQWWSSAGKREPRFQSFGQNRIQAYTRACETPSPCRRVIGIKQNVCSMTLLESGPWIAFLDVSYRLSDRGCELRRGR